MPMTIEQILRNTPNERVLNSRKVVVKDFKEQRSKDGKLRAMATTFTSGTSKDKYETSITSLKPATELLRTYVKVSCSCPDFWATWEVALHNRGAANIVYSNGEAPDIRNPGEIPGMCKHIVALFNIIKAGNADIQDDDR